MDMVDDLTPYYQDRMRQLAPAQRKIVEFLCLEGKPTTIKDISTPCLMSQQTAAKQIGELEAAGFVDRTRVGRNTYCELSEPLMRICIEVKDNKTQHFRLFVEFLRYWFTSRELEQRHVALQREPNAALDLIHVDAAELQPHSPEPSVELSSQYVDAGVFDPVADSAAKVEAVLGGLLLRRLLAAQAIAAREPLLVALDSLDAALGVENFESDEDRHIEATVGILTVSVRSFGPRQLPQGLAKLRYLLTDRLEGHVGGILTDFLKANVKDGLAGSLVDWEQALEGLAASLADLPNCRIPIEMLQVAVRYTKTSDERHLLSLPLEQRQLLENELRPTAG